MTKQALKVLNVIKSHGEGGVHPTTLIFEAKATQPNARIKEIRDAFGCMHRHSDNCSSQEHIINKRLENGTTVYIYERVGANVDWNKMREDDKKVINSQDTLF